MTSLTESVVPNYRVKLCLTPNVLSVSNPDREIVELYNSKITKLTNTRFSNKHPDSGFDLLAHTFAATREVSVRTTGLRHFDCQMLGGIALSEGNIAEMKTGEGKTLVATLPAYFNAVKDNKVIDNYVLFSNSSFFLYTFSTVFA